MKKTEEIVLPGAEKSLQLQNREFAQSTASGIA